MMTPRTNADDFAARGWQYEEAFTILSRNCAVPPSLEGFEGMLEEQRAQHSGHITPQDFAAFIARSYRRIR